MGTIVIALLIGSIVLVAIFSGIDLMDAKDKQHDSDCDGSEGGEGKGKKEDKGKRGNDGNC